MRINFRPMAIAAALCLAMLTGVRAETDRYEFTVNWNQGELSSTNSHGWL